MLREIVIVILALTAGFYMATFFSFLKTTVWLSGEAFSTLEKIAQKMNAPPETVLNCAFTLLSAARDIYKRNGALIERVNDHEVELDLQYTNNYGEEVMLSEEKEHYPGFSERDKNFLREIGIDPDQTIES